jgi:hypothetical protein
MSGFTILIPTWTAGATATSNSTANAQLAASNLLLTQPSRFWRTATDTGIQLTLDAGEARPWDTVALLYNNGYTGTAIFKANASTGTLFSSPSSSSGTQTLVLPGGSYPFPHHHTWYAAPTTRNFRYLGIEISDASNPDGYFEAGVVMAGLRFQPGPGADIGSSRSYDDPSVAQEMVSGETIVRAKRSRMTGTWTFPYQSEASVEVWDYLIRAFGKKIPLVFKWEPRVNPLLQQQGLYYGFVEWGDMVFRHAHGLWDVQVSIREL